MRITLSRYLNAATLASGVLLAVALAARCPPAFAADAASRTPPPAPDYVSFTGGRFDAIDRDYTAADFGIELRDGKPLVGPLLPLMGLHATGNGGGYFLGGLRFDVTIAESVVISPDLDLAYYTRGNGKDLGSNLLFRGGVLLGFRSAGGTQIGIEYHRFSNVGLFSNRDPGTDTIELSIAVPLHSL